MATQPTTSSTYQDMIQALITNGISEFAFYNNKYRYFFDPMCPEKNPPALFTRTADEIWQVINYGDNSDCCVLLVGDDNHLDNTDIQIFLCTLGANEVNNSNRYYNIALFNAFLAIINPLWPILKFEFTKACQPPDPLGPTDSCDIIFRVVFVDQLSSPVYWDLSGTVRPGKPPTK